MSEIKRPREFYRYRGYTTSDLNVSKLKSRLKSELEEAAKARVWFSAFGKQNDPFDTNPQFVDSRKSDVRNLHKAIQAKVGPYAALSGNDLREKAQYAGLSPTRLRRELGRTGYAVRQLRDIFDDRRWQQNICCFFKSKGQFPYVVILLSITLLILL